MDCLKCNKRFTLISIVKKIEKDKRTYSHEEICEYLKELFDIKVVTPKDEQYLDEVFSFYEKNKFSLVPVAKNAKNPVEINWTNKTHYEKQEWLKWMHNGLNVGLRTGKVSNITVIDIDQEQIPDELKMVLTSTLVQKTNKGWHYIYQYEESLPKTRLNELEVDIENDGGQIVIHPSTIDGVNRDFVEMKEPTKMSQELINFLLKFKPAQPQKTYSEKFKEIIQTET
jgi:hypothetical protein